MMRSKNCSLWAMMLGVVLLLPIGLGTLAEGADQAKPIRALLVLGGCCHDYGKQKDLITEGISARTNVTWTVAYDPNTTTRHLNPVYDREDWAKDFDVIVHDEC
ncbi:MAG TPA: hypothetical protein VHV08_16680, partial [Pirellulales bacterium]|nr:hypothetical protein [Pirellulales bacterium]